MTKKAFFKSSFVLLGAGLAGFVSCTNEDENSVTPDEKGLIPVEIRSSISGNSRTKLSDSDHKTVEFQSGDSLAVWDGQGDQEIRRFGTDGTGNVAIFKGNLDPDANAMSILYPLQDGATCTGGTITATIPTEQTATENTFDPSANLSVATANYVKGQNVTCTLQNVCGLLKFTVESDKTYAKAIIRGANGEKIAGKFKIRSSDAIITDTVAGEKEITLTGTIEGGKNYYVAILPQTFSKGIVIEFFTASAFVGTAKIFKGSTFSTKPATILNVADEVTPLSYADLGVPSGLLWATHNVDAKNPSEWIAGHTPSAAFNADDPVYGNLYSWGNVTTQTSYAIDNYTGTPGAGLTADITPGDKNHDAAAKNWDAPWQMPTDVQFQELRDNCYWIWVTSYNGVTVNGYIVYRTYNDTDKGKLNVIAPSGHSYKVDADTHIFLPVGGYARDNSDVRYMHAEAGLFWMTKYTSPLKTCLFHFNSTSTLNYTTGDSFCGCSIRPVRSVE